MPHVDIKCFPRELTDEQKTALAADITEVLIRHLNSKESAVSVALTQVEPDAWQAVWDSEIAPQMAQLIKKPGYSMKLPLAGMMPASDARSEPNLRLHAEVPCPASGKAFAAEIIVDRITIRCLYPSSST